MLNTKSILEIYTIKNSGVYDIHLYDRNFNFIRNFELKMSPSELKQYIKDNYPKHKIFKFEYTKEEIYGK